MSLMHDAIGKEQILTLDTTIKNMTKETELQLVSFVLAKLLKEAGFDWECDYWYNSDGHIQEEKHFPLERYIENTDNEMPYCIAPTLDLAQKWLRDEHNILLVISTLIEESDDDSGDIGCLICEGYLLNHKEENKIFDFTQTLRNDTNYYTIFDYELVQEAGLIEACKYRIKLKNK